MRARGGLAALARSTRPTCLSRRNMITNTATLARTFTSDHNYSKALKLGGQLGANWSASSSRYRRLKMRTKLLSLPCWEPAWAHRSTSHKAQRSEHRMTTGMPAQFTRYCSGPTHLHVSSSVPAQMQECRRKNGACIRLLGGNFWIDMSSRIQK